MNGSDFERQCRPVSPLHFEFSFVIVISGKAYIKIVFGPCERFGNGEPLYQEEGHAVLERCVRKEGRE